MSHRLISGELPAERHALAARLQKGVIGQERACELAAGVRARFKAGLNDPDKPVGTLARTLFGDEQRMTCMVLAWTRGARAVTATAAPG